MSLVAAALILAVAIALVIKSKVHLIRCEEVLIPSGGITLAASLALPRWGDGPFPAVVVVHGSGRVIRRDLRGYGGQLAPEGMAVLFYDKRGVGKSTGRFRPFSVANCDTLIRELAADALSAVNYLKGRKDIDVNRIGLIGGSQAGWIMPLAASQSSDISFVVSFSGPAVSCGQVDYYQRLTGGNGSSPTEFSEADIRDRVGMFKGPPGFDPAPVLENVSAPMLWILGSEDLNVPSPLTASRVEELIKNGHRNHSVKIYPGADHDLRGVTAGRSIDPLPDILNWLDSIGALRR